MIDPRLCEAEHWQVDPILPSRWWLVLLAFPIGVCVVGAVRGWW